jgi:CheY-like chemotaxis protein
LAKEKSYRKTYYIFLITLVALIVSSQYLLQNEIAQQKNDAFIVHSAANQNVLSKQMLNMLLQANWNDKKQSLAPNLVAQVDEIEKEMLANQQSQFRTSMQIPVAVQNSFASMQNIWLIIKQQNILSDSLVNKLMQQEAVYSTELTSLMPQVEAIHQQKLTRLQWIAGIIGAITLAVFFVQLLYLFLPVFKNLRTKNVELKDKTKRLESLAFSVSHQLRLPINRIQSLIQLYEEENNQSENNKEIVAGIKSSARELIRSSKELNDIISNQTEVKTGIYDESALHKDIGLIYLVDDDSLTNKVVTKMIEKNLPNVKIESFTHAKDAFAKLDAEKVMPDVIFLDINMPEMNGWDFLAKFDQYNLGSKVFMLTSSIDPNDITKCVEFKSVAGYLNKPLKQKDIHQMLNGVQNGTIG